MNSRENLSVFKRSEFDNLPADIESDIFYFIDSHEYNRDLLNTLGFSLFNDNDDNRYVYNVLKDNSIDKYDNELIRFKIYYQLSFPDFDDRQLEVILDELGGARFINKLIDNLEESVLIYKRLKEIFDSKKGNVIQFKKRSD